MKRFRTTAAILGVLALSSGKASPLLGAAPSRLARFYNNGGDGGGAGGSAPTAEDLQKRLTDSESRVQSLSLRLQVERSARRKGVVDEEAAFALLDTSRVKYDSEGNPSNVDELLDEMATQRPWLTGQSGGNNGPVALPTGGSVTNPARTARRGLTKDDVARMSHDEINARWDEVQRVLAQ